MLILYSKGTPEGGSGEGNEVDAVNIFPPYLSLVVAEEF